MNQSLNQFIEIIPNNGEKKHLEVSKYFATSSLTSWILSSIVFAVSISANSATKIQ